MLLRMTDINKFYNGNQVLSHVSLTVEDHDRIGLVGVNGCGKSTLLRILTEQELPDHLVEGDGEIARSAKTSIGYLEQMGGLDRESTVWEEMRSVFRPLLETQERMHQLEEAMQSGDMAGAEEYHRLQTWFENNGGYQIDVKIRTVLNGMGFTQETYSRIISGFSGGEKTRLAIARLLLEEPNLLILDEPTNHLDFKTVMWLEDYLKDYQGALLLVSHDRYFLDRLCTSVCEIERGRLTRYKGNYTTFTQLKEAAVARQWKEYEMQQKEIAKLEDYVARNLTRASTAKSAQSRVKQLEKMERIEKPLVSRKQARVEFTYEMDPPQEVLKVQDVDISVGEGTERKMLLPDVSFEVRRGEKWGIIGDNGIGKSTLLKSMLGLLKPMKGEIVLDRSLRAGAIGYLPQQTQAQKDFPATVTEVVRSGFLNGRGAHFFYTAQEKSTALMHMGKLGILELKDRCYRELSGGQQQRVLLARALCAAGELLVLDEPVTGLDPAAAQDLYRTLDYLNKKEGLAIVMVTHDLRSALPHATAILHAGHGGWFYGDTAAYLASPYGKRFGGDGI